jgi:hypothetical protein
VTVQHFRDIAVHPPQQSFLDGLLADGGPVWPDFDTQLAVRHCRGGRAVDRTPAPWDAPYHQIDSPQVWGGFLHYAFGHLVAELTTRIPQSLETRPDDRVLFVTTPGLSRARLRPNVQDLLAWYGLGPDPWDLVTTGLQVADLRVAPQAGQLFGPPPSPETLARLDRIATRNALCPERAPLVYVHRLGMIARGSGAHAGERYLVDRLSAVGIPVLDPATAPLRRQLEVYAGASVIVFAEGSAAHGRQVLGRRDQTVTILNRRPGERLAKAALGARVSHLTHAEATATIIAGVRTDGAIRFQKGLSIFDLPAVFAAFAAHGVHLAHGWNMTAYRASVIADLHVWAEMMRKLATSTDLAATRQRVETGLAAAGLPDHVAGVMERIVDAPM